MNRDFYTRHDVVQISRDLLGKTLLTQIDGIVTGGIIVETEAYCGATDAACHAYPNKHTERTRTMYQQGGCAYVYICYGIHCLFNVVTNQAGIADAVLIRAIEPTIGIATMQQRRKLNNLSPQLTAGPGCLTQALGITKIHNNTDLTQANASIWIEDANLSPTATVGISRRIGVEGAGAAAAALPWRFYITDNKWVSRYK
jgi:DNA-3-methyladenine glycosylase